VTRQNATDTVTRMKWIHLLVPSALVLAGAIAACSADDAADDDATTPDASTSSSSGGSSPEDCDDAVDAILSKLQECGIDVEGEDGEAGAPADDAGAEPECTEGASRAAKHAASCYGAASCDTLHEVFEGTDGGSSASANALVECLSE
jgi:hypothetical protein